MRLSIASYGLLIMTVCFLLQLEISWLGEHAERAAPAGSEAEQARAYYELYENIWKDLVYFPVPESVENEEAVVSYENTWMYERSYGGSYGHEGTDLMAKINRRGYYPIISVSDGVVENIGWLEKGGWRIGIRSPRGAYFYYAHLESYAEGLEKGDVVKAGQFLGFMGDSGYGSEGTVGKFDIHLHFGIYVRTEEIPELSVNPYWFLKYLEKDKLTYSY